jgi:hypothetical protein
METNPEIISYRDQEKGQIPSRIMVRLTQTTNGIGEAVYHGEVVVSTPVALA